MNEILFSENFNKNLRLGVYGLIFVNSRLLLVKKKKGPYKDLYDLPGGKVEFAEHPEEALKREMIEEVSLSIGKMSLMNVFSYHSSFNELGKAVSFQHIGLVYIINAFDEVKDHTPEEHFVYMPTNNLDIEILTPLTKQAFNQYQALKVNQERKNHGIVTERNRD